jgi:hypothetical protein
LFTALLLSTFAAGSIATAVMLFALYLPRAWGGETFDVAGAIGSAVTGEVNDRAVFIGAALYFLGGIVFALFYGWIAMLLITSTGIAAPQLPLDLGTPTDVNLFFPLLGAILGLAHGGIVALFGTIIVIEHHPIERFRTRYTLILSQIFSHVVYGAVVMFFHHQFLQLLIHAGSNAG